MKNKEILENPALIRLHLFILVTPLIGFFPALWTLYRRQGTPEEKAVSRLAITMALVWLAGHFVFEAGALASETGAIPVLLASSLLTTSYFLISLGLMMRIWRRQPLWLPVISRLSEQFFGKHLS